MKRHATLAFGLVAYAVFFATFLWAIAFVGNLPFPKTIDSGPSVPVEQAVLVDTLLLGLFALQHSVMARPAFKRWWTRLVPAVLERSVYVLLASVLLALLFWHWRPMPEPVWQIDAPVLRDLFHALFWLGWLTVLVSTFLIDHFELFGVRQVVLHWRGGEPGSFEFRMPALYRVVRHPIMLGFIIAFWSAPVMSRGHLLFAATTTVYILVAIRLEERDLVARFGEAYREYQRRVGMIVPSPRAKGRLF